MKYFLAMLLLFSFSAKCMTQVTITENRKGIWEVNKCQIGKANYHKFKRKLKCKKTKQSKGWVTTTKKCYKTIFTEVKCECVESEFVIPGLKKSRGLTFKADYYPWRGILKFRKLDRLEISKPDTKLPKGFEFGKTTYEEIKKIYGEGWTYNNKAYVYSNIGVTFEFNELGTLSSIALFKARESKKTTSKK